MTDINNLFALDWVQWITLTLIIIVGLTALYKLLSEFCKIVKLIYCKIKKIDQTPKNQAQDLEIDKIKVRQDKFEENLNFVKESVMVSTWDRIVHFGMNYIQRGHISYAEKDIFMAQIRSYKNCGGNGHLIAFAPMVENLPYTEDLTDDEAEAIENDEVLRKKRMAIARASLSSYYTR